MKTRIIEKRPRKTFSERLAQKLTESGGGTIEMGRMSDNSCQWIDMKVNGTILCFTFDSKGEDIERVELFKEIVQVVDQEKIWPL